MDIRDMNEQWEIGLWKPLEASRRAMSVVRYARAVDLPVPGPPIIAIFPLY